MLKGFDFNKILEALSSMGAASVRILNEDFRRSLLKEAENYSYKQEKEIVGSGDRIVRQQLGTCEQFSKGSQYYVLKNSFQALLEEYLADLETNPFKTALKFNSMALQKYEKGSLGITPHRDGSKYINLICVFNIGGRGKFYLSSDRCGSQAKEIDASPGNVVFMKAPGFLGSIVRPFHYVTDIEKTRYSFGLRQKRLEV